MAMLFSYFELAASLFILVLAFYIYNRHYANKAARFYARLALVCFLAAIFEYSMRIAFTLEIARHINRLSVICWLLAFTLFVHFALIFTKKDQWLKNKVLAFLLYLPALIFSSIFLFTNIMYQRYEIQPIGIVSQPSEYYWWFVLYGIIYAGWGLWLFLSYSRTARQRMVRRQSLFIALGSMLPLLAGIVTDEIMPLVMGNRLIFPTCVFDLALMNLAIFLAMRRYSLFAITPSLAAETIIQTMPDPLVVTDLGGRILLLNKEADKLFHCQEEDLEGHNIRHVFKDEKQYEELYKQVVDHNKEVLKFEALVLDPQERTFPALINANQLRDSLGASLGVVYIIRKNFA